MNRPTPRHARKPHRSRHGWRPWGLLLGTILAAALLAAAPIVAGAAGTLRLDFIDVGQGDAVLVTSPTGKTALIDGGPLQSARALTAFLAAHTHGPLDLVLLTHPHEDHLGGLAAVVSAIGARSFLDAPAPYASPAYASLLRVLQSRGVTVRQAIRGRTIDLGGGAILVLVGPPEPPIAGSRSDVNANSVVTRLTFGKFAALLAGDAEAPTEAWLLRAGTRLSGTLLKVAHHGSRYATGERFLAAVRPQIAVISCGAGNEYGHPAPQTLARLARAGARVYRTDVNGTVTIETNGTSVRVRADAGPGEAIDLR